ncbi:hypothetical protein [Lacisediminihabitans profunda]|uniref:Uncharacterized protein n=1 Tax=Lacisediminihabitans profunda TaxID=2594790 RepID=A0A5C8US53_9MICO|nr:hypothetical protein [Lacisediminihabitans profunda]TXN30333.1 hypothetical protein FVP33_09965 [Lacisediminihabitans profunda]
MSRQQGLGVYRFFFAALGLAGLLAQYLYYTVESNIIAVVSLAVSGAYFLFAWLQSWTTSLRIRFETSSDVAAESP